MSSNKRMSTPFNKEAEYERDVAPLLRQAWEACKNADIPCIFAVCHTNTPDGYGLGKAVHFIGKDRTPAEFVMADVAMEHDIQLAALGVITGKIEGNDRSGESESDAPVSIEA